MYLVQVSKIDLPFVLRRLRSSTRKAGLVQIQQIVDRLMIKFTTSEEAIEAVHYLESQAVYNGFVLTWSRCS